MHGGTRLLIVLALTACCLLPSTAVAAPMPAGTYDMQVTSGTVKLGSLTEQGLTSGTLFSVPVGTTPVTQPIGLTIPDIPVNTPVGNGAATVTVMGAGITIDPTTGNATLDGSFTISLSIPLVGSCTLGSAGSPITVHLTTANGSPWDATTGAFQMVDKTFALPSPSCSNPIIGGAIALVLNTVAGSNVITLNGIAARRADTPSPGTTPPPGNNPGGGTTTPTGGNPNGVTPVTTPTTKSCVVPKLVGKTLKQAKRALKKAGCRAGKTKKTYSKKGKKGRVVKQRYKAGKKLKAGAKVPITVSRGPKKPRKR